jgi:hypothetical protein
LTEANGGQRWPGGIIATDDGDRPDLTFSSPSRMSNGTADFNGSVRYRAARQRIDMVIGCSRPQIARQIWEHPPKRIRAPPRGEQWKGSTGAGLSEASAYRLMLSMRRE